jgi:transposase-like protein
MFLKGYRNMAKQLNGTEIVSKLRQADVLIAQGKTVPEVCREIGVSQQTYYRWRNKYGGMSPDMIKQYKELQKENARLRKVVSDQAIDLAILRWPRETFKPGSEAAAD